MSSKVPVDQASPQITEPMQTPEEMVSTGNDTIAKINASANIANASEVAANVKAWATVNTALDTNNKAKANAKAQLQQTETAEPALVRRWKVRRDMVLTAIKSFGDGSKQAVQGFNVEVAQRQVKPLAVLPENLRALKKPQPTYANVRWDKVPGAHGYVLQHCTNTADPTTYSAPINLSEARYHLSGQTPGTTVWFRVAACDSALPNGQTAFTAWVPVVVIG
jgi:hypothetical protein